MKQKLVEEIIEIANRYTSETDSLFYHLNNKMGAGRYVRDAVGIMNALKPDATILDIGCGRGQMSYLLKRLGFKVSGSDIKENIPYYIQHYNQSYGDGIDYRQINILKHDDPAFQASQAFDAICISGVLEHVSDLGLFLAKLKKMLVKNGKLFIFRFPNRYSWIEKVNDVRFGISADHPLRFSLHELHFMLRWHGFKVDSCRYEEILPVNMRGFPAFIATNYHRIAPALLIISRALRAVPLVNKLSTSFAFQCTKAWDD